MPTYKIQPGDTLSKIARQHNTTVAAITKANGIENPNLVRAGQILQIPDAFEAPSTSTPLSPEQLGQNAGGDFVNARFAGDAKLLEVARGNAVLAKGEKGEAVTRVQQALLDMGFALRPYTASSGKLVGGVDGQYGNQTTNALLNFQRHAGHFFPSVRPTGTLDAATLKALDLLAPGPDGKPSPYAKAPAPFYEGTQVRVVVCKDEHRTYLFDEEGKLSRVFSNAVGAAASQTDCGLKRVRTRLGKEATEQAGKQLWGSPQTFGDRIIDLVWADGKPSGEELHGTYAYDKMGQDVSHGCVRHYNEDIIELFDALRVGDKVAIVDSITDPNLS